MKVVEINNVYKEESRNKNMIMLPVIIYHEDFNFYDLKEGKDKSVNRNSIVSIGSVEEKLEKNELSERIIIDIISRIECNANDKFLIKVKNKNSILFDYNNKIIEKVYKEEDDYNNYTFKFLSMNENIELVIDSITKKSTNIFVSFIIKASLYRYGELIKRIEFVELDDYIPKNLFIKLLTYTESSILDLNNYNIYLSVNKNIEDKKLYKELNNLIINYKRAEDEDTAIYSFFSKIIIINILNIDCENIFDIFRMNITAKFTYMNKEYYVKVPFISDSKTLDNSKLSSLLFSLIDKTPKELAILLKGENNKFTLSPKLPDNSYIDINNKLCINFIANCDYDEENKKIKINSGKISWSKNIEN